MILEQHSESFNSRTSESHLHWLNQSKSNRGILLTTPRITVLSVSCVNKQGLGFVVPNPSLSWLCFITVVGSRLRLGLWESDRVYLTVVIHKMDLQALGDVVLQVREVLPVLSWQDDAGHTSTTGLRGQENPVWNWFQNYFEVTTKTSIFFALTAVG